MLNVQFVIMQGRTEQEGEQSKHREDIEIFIWSGKFLK
jgi:hypothetical protein